MSDELERRLKSTDFSEDCRVRACLRARLLARRPSRRPAPALVLVFAAAAAAVLFFPRPKPRPEAPVAAAIPPAPPLPPARKSAFPRGEHGLPVLPGVLAERAGTFAHPIEVHRGREVRGKDSTAVVWEIDGTRYGLETRRITLDDIFETRAL